MFTPKPPATSPDLVDIKQGESSNDIIANSSTYIASQMTCKKIYTLLSRHDKSIKIIDNSKKHSANCWNQFGFPVLMDQTGIVMAKLTTFVSCKQCFVTYNYNTNSTSQINKHNCDNSSNQSSIENVPNTSSYKQTQFVSYSSNRSKLIKLSETEN